MKRISPEEIDKLTDIELEKLNKWRREEYGMPPTTWLGELNPEVVAQAQLEADQKELKEIFKRLERGRRWHKSTAESPIADGICISEIDWEALKQKYLGGK